MNAGEEPEKDKGMGATEEAGKVASSVVDALKANPSCLAALAVVALFGVLQYFDSRDQSSRMMERTKQVADLLEKCLDRNKNSSIDFGPVAADWWMPDKKGTKP
jgi:hypothetical protein